MSVEIYEVKCAKCGSEQIKEEYTNICEDVVETFFTCCDCGTYNKAIYKYEKTVSIEDDE